MFLKELYLIQGVFYFYESKYLPLNEHQLFFIKLGSDLIFTFFIVITLFIKRSNNSTNKIS
ncbi:hypothetical protein CTM83_01885 [Photobacterium leiognathi subsp. mandapamensis]|nr:hypothetical protein CTM83_01885 [Photobacterium leiognathi subsp. mandapamensis]PSW67404.1 hypothetical protein C0W88_04345 [Photobacterium leiognathi subsp. mandapamensis]